MDWKMGKKWGNFGFLCFYTKYAKSRIYPTLLYSISTPPLKYITQYLPPYLKQISHGFVGSIGSFLRGLCGGAIGL